MKTDALLNLQDDADSRLSPISGGIAAEIVEGPHPLTTAATHTRVRDRASGVPPGDTYHPEPGAGAPMMEDRLMTTGDLISHDRLLGSMEEIIYNLGHNGTDRIYPHHPRL